MGAGCVWGRRLRFVGHGVGQQPPHHVELVVARPNLGLFFLAHLLVLGLHHLGVILQGVGQALAGQYLTPQVAGLESVRLAGMKVR